MVDFRGKSAAGDFTHNNSGAMAIREAFVKEPVAYVQSKPATWTFITFERQGCCQVSDEVSMEFDVTLRYEGCTSLESLELWWQRLAMDSPWIHLTLSRGYISVEQ